MNVITPLKTTHVDKINEYVKWLFKRTEPFVVLKRFNDPAKGITKMYIALPVRERKFEVNRVRVVGGYRNIYPNIHDSKVFNTPGFDFTSADILESKTIYSGNIFEFYNITDLLSKFKFITRTPNILNQKENITIFRDYTRTRQQQEDSLTLIESFTDPEQSVNSVFRLLSTKYVTIIDITFKNANYIDPKKHGNKTV